MNTDSSALINSLGSTRDFLATKQAKLPHRGDVPPMPKPAHHQLTTSSVQAIPGSSMPSPVGSMPPPSQDTDAESPLTLQGLIDSFGRDSSSPDASLPYDLNSDGVVNILDLIQFLMHGAPPSSGPTDRPEEKGNSPSLLTSPGEAQLSPAPDPSPGVTVADTVDETDHALAHHTTLSPDEAPDEEGETPLNLQGLLDSWGQANSPYDLNRDGIVNVLDLIQWLMEGPDSGEAPGTGTAESSAPATPAPSLAARDQVKLRHMAGMLVSNLSDAGFTHRPPSDLGEKIDALKLNGPQKRFVLGHIASHYPHGLGVSLVG